MLLICTLVLYSFHRNLVCLSVRQSVRVGHFLSLIIPCDQHIIGGIYFQLLSYAYSNHILGFTGLIIVSAAAPTQVIMVIWSSKESERKTRGERLALS